MPLTDQQRNALPVVRARFSGALVPSSTAKSVDEHAQLPAQVPPDVTVRVEIAPPSPNPPLPHLRAPERVPVYFFTLGHDQPTSNIAHTHVLFFIHGGANITGHPTDPPFVHLFAQLLRGAAAHAGGDPTRCVLVAPSYRLATVPENAFPAALQDLMAAYDHLLGKGYSAANIVVAGDSAGGNQAVVLTHLVLQSGRPAPRGVVAIAPAAIWAYDRMSEHAKALASVDVVDVSNTDTLAALYVGDSGVAPTDPLVSGAYTAFDASWPKTLILVGTADQLIDASRELERRLASTQRVELVEYDELPHAWWILADIFPQDIQDAVQRITRFLLQG